MNKIFSFLGAVLIATSAFSQVVPLPAQMNNYDVERASIVKDTMFTHSLSQEIEDVTIVECAEVLGGYHFHNSYTRIFNLATDFGINEAFTLKSVDVAVRFAGGVEGDQNIYVKLYTLNGEPDVENLTLFHEQVHSIVNEDAGSIVNIPLTRGFIIPPGVTLVYEVDVPFTDGEGNLFLIGTNSKGQTSPSYWGSTFCGKDKFTDMEDEHPGRMFVMNIHGDILSGPYPEVFSPALYEEEAALDAPVSIQFDVNIEEIDLSGVTITPDPGNVIAATDGNTLIVAHDDFDYDTEYVVTVPVGCISDGADALAFNLIWGFKTIAEPTYNANFTVSNNNGPMTGATVTIDGNDYTTVLGNVVVPLVNGNYEYTVSSAGYTAQNGNITIQDEEITKDIVLWLVGVNEFENQIALYPNPAIDFIVIENQMGAEIEIFDISGKQVLSTSLTSNKQHINVATLKKGTYLVKVTNGQKSYRNKLMIK